MRGKDVRMLFSLIYFFTHFSIFYIPHNYVIPQAMPHAIPHFTLIDIFSAWKIQLLVVSRLVRKKEFL